MGTVPELPPGVPMSGTQRKLELISVIVQVAVIVACLVGSAFILHLHYESMVETQKDKTNENQ